MKEIKLTVFKKLLEWGEIQAGKLADTPLFNNLMLDSPTSALVGFQDEEQLNQIREERNALMLALDVRESEEQWVQYQYEETQIKLDLADMLLDFLATETVQILQTLLN